MQGTVMGTLKSILEARGMCERIFSGGPASGRETEEGTLKVRSSGPQSGFDYQAYLTPICAPMLLKP